MQRHRHPITSWSMILTGLLLGVALWTHSLAAAADPVVPATSGWPLEGPGRVLRPFDPPATPWGRGHRGVDLAANIGDRWWPPALVG